MSGRCVFTCASNSYGSTGAGRAGDRTPCRARRPIFADRLRNASVMVGRAAVPARICYGCSVRDVASGLS